MKTLVKAFKTVNNRAGGVHGAKKLSNSAKSKNLITLLEGSGEITVLSCENSSRVLINKGTSKMLLQKSNKSAWVSDKQLYYFRNSKRKISILYSKQGLIRSDRNKTVGKRSFIRFW